MSVNENNFIWIDFEMIGLDLECDCIIEIVILVIDVNLNILVEGLIIVVYQLDVQLVLMDEWNVWMYIGSGLVDCVKVSIVSEYDVELVIIEFFKQWVLVGKLLICGNSIGQDCCFLFKYML